VYPIGVPSFATSRKPGPRRFMRSSASLPLRWRAARPQDDKSDRETPAAGHSRLGEGEVRDKRSRATRIVCRGVGPVLGRDRTYVAERSCAASAV
jgi:hypothetical protein